MKFSAEPRLNKFLGLGPHGFHRVAYAEWGNPRSNHIVVCAHGFARNSRDFDVLAAALARHSHVLSMDVVGRGASDWLEHKEDYGFQLYLSDAAALLARATANSTHNGVGGLTRRILGIKAGHKIDWIGTSMGGLIGMILAAKPNSPIRRLVLNDVGPLVPWPALFRLKNMYSGMYARFADLSEVEQYLRNTCASFGPLEPHQWRHIARHSSYLKDDRYELAYDPAIVSALRNGNNKEIEFGTDFLAGVDLWPVWDAIKCPTLVLRGSESDLLLETTARQMEERGPRAKVVEFPNIGHAPWLMSTDQIGVIRDFVWAR
jgi:pimeloyl-ACP methyl ester carboxylesterase